MDAPTSEISDEFAAASRAVQSLAAKGDLKEDDLLRLYGLYKQATEGKCTTTCPSIFDFKGRVKWRAWIDVGDMPSADASREYIDLLSKLHPSWQSGAKEEPKGGVGGAVFSSLAHDGASSEEDELNEAPELIVAASMGDDARVLILLNEGANVNQRDSEGCTPLHWAADKGHLGTIKCLLASGADVHAVDTDGLTALHYAALAEQKLAAEMLLKAGSPSDGKKQSADGSTAEKLAPESWGLMFASCKGS